jgi:dsDNA-specific endonuclease/ATPase MutS2
MIFDFLLKAFRKNRSETSPKARNSIQEPEDDSFDSENPFPDIVVIEFRDVLDLHSIPARQVRAVVEDYLEEAHSRGLRFVRIIHGKGIGVQREIIRSILARTPFVSDYRDAPPEAGGWGATVVTLTETRNDE